MPFRSLNCDNWKLKNSLRCVSANRHVGMIRLTRERVDNSFISFWTVKRSTWKRTYFSHRTSFPIAGHDPRARMHSKAFHRRTRLPHQWWNAQSLLWKVGQDRRRGGDEGSKNKAISWIRLHLVLALEYGRRCSASKAACDWRQVSKWQVSFIYSSSSESRLNIIEIGVSMLLHQRALGIDLQFQLKMLEMWWFS